MNPRVTVITPSLPERSELLAKAVASVEAQTVPVEHLIDADPDTPVAEKRNRMIERADTEWVAFLDDDDTLDPHHIETLLGHDADVVIPHCRFIGEPLPPPAKGCCAGYCNRPFDRDDLRDHGIFPITVLVLRQAILDVGGFGDGQWEDWDLWNDMADAGATFEVVPVVTWTYRRDAVSRSRPPATLEQRAVLALKRRAPWLHRTAKRLFR